MSHSTVHNATGAVVFWNTSATNRKKLSDSLEAASLQQYIPDERSDMSAFKLALTEYAKAGRPKGCKVMVHPNLEPEVNGFSVTVETPTTEKCVYDLNFVAKYINGVVDVSDPTVDTQSILDYFRDAKNKLDGTDIGKKLHDWLTDNRCKLLRVKGGVWWIPANILDNFGVLRVAVEAAAESYGSTEIGLSFTKADDAESARMIRSAVRKEVLEKAQTLLSRALSSNLSDEQIHKAVDDALELHKEVSEYEAILSETMQDLHEALDAVETAASFVAMKS